MTDQLHCLFSATVERRDDSHVVEVPARELQLGAIRSGETYRVALLPAHADGPADQVDQADSQAERSPPDPPVAEGEERTVEIEAIGDQGDGIARVERGYVIIVPDTEQGERVRIEITDVRQNVAFADVGERLSYYE